MSEQSSLYCKVKITKPRLETFLNSASEKLVLDGNWLEWWENRTMYSKMTPTAKELYAYNDLTNYAIFKEWYEAEQTFAFSDYDETTQQWHLGILLFSENYLEMLPMLAFIKSMEAYVTESIDNFAIVYPFFWGDTNVDVFIKFKDGKALLDSKVQSTDDIDTVLLETTSGYLNNKWSELSANMEID
ncbi:hypothetical protein Flavo103_44190 [Flavobacterium collinsii]|nr:hypothetical protein Flavo103_44190 [Flavobacterium collinsii]